MTAPQIPPPLRLPLAIAIGVLAVSVPLSALQAGNERADALTAASRSGHVATAATSSPGDDRRVAASATKRGARMAQAPLPEGELAEQAKDLLTALGVEHGETVTNTDLAVAAQELGVETHGWVREEHLEQMEDVFLQRAEPAVVGLGIEPVAKVEPEHVRQAAAVVGVEVGEKVGPTDVATVIEKAPDAQVGPTPRFAVVGGINLRMPTRVPLMVGFHQASYPNALAMHDTGHRVNRLLPTRARASAPTSAVDVRVPADTVVLSPIRGTVVEMTPYNLYGKHPDWKIRMVPESDPNLLITILHVTDPLVQVGQVLEAGDRLAAKATLFPFESQIDRFAGRGPHVHIEARHR